MPTQTVAAPTIMAVVAACLTIAVFMVPFGPDERQNYPWKRKLINVALMLPATLMAVYGINCTWHGKCRAYSYFIAVGMFLVPILLGVVIVFQKQLGLDEDDIRRTWPGYQYHYGVLS
jgi:hypothetical protein